tara:strand:- start:920 stop:1207 length:288 start_codon:yes stop_codon:yes gene_type:complete
MTINPDDFIAIKEVYPETYRLGVDGAFKEDGTAISINQSSINTKKVELASKEYRTNRSFEYPPLGDQLDDLFHKGVFSDEMTAKIQAVKTKYPKP